MHRDYLKERASHVQRLPAFRHTFSHYHLRIQPICITLTRRTDRPSFFKFDQAIWYDLTKKEAVGLPKPVVDLLTQLS